WGTPLIASATRNREVNSSVAPLGASREIPSCRWASSSTRRSAYLFLSSTRMVSHGLAAARASLMVWYVPPALESWETVRQTLVGGVSQARRQSHGSTPAGGKAPT